MIYRFLRSSASKPILLYSGNLLVALLVGIFATTYDAFAWQQERLRVGAEFDFPPFTMVDDSGHATGFAVDLLSAVTKQVNLRPVYELGTWNSVREKLETGQIDVVPLMAVSPGRNEKVDFSEIHSVGYDAVFVRTNETRIHSEKELSGKTVLAQRGDFSADILNSAKFNAQFAGREPIKLIYTDTIEQSFKLLLSGAGDAFVCSQIPALLVLQNMGTHGIRLADKPMISGFSRSYAFGIRKGNKELINRLNEGLKTVVASGEYDTLYNKWFSKLDPAIRERTEKAHLFVQLAIGFGIAVLIAVIAIVFVIIFRKEVNRKAASLAESELRFENVVNNLPGVVFSCHIADDANSVSLTYISEFVEQMTGYPTEVFTAVTKDSVRNPVRQIAINLLYDEDRDPVLHTIKQNFLNRERTEIEFRVLRKDGSILWLQARAAAPTPAPDGGDWIINGIFFDITERKKIADLMSQQQSKLAASSRLSSLGEMAGGIAHEINNPLAIINLRTHQLTQLAKKGPVAPDSISLIVNGIEATAERISRIVKSLQKVSRESEGDPFEVVKLREIIDETFELCYQRMLNNGIQITVYEFPADLTLECRRIQISQVLINLLNNAFDAIFDQPERQVEISVKEIDDKIELAVTNSGPAIPRELSHKIFQPFFTTKGVGKGTGLGLSISKGLVERHGGEIQLDLESKKTRFVVTLPKSQTGRHPPSVSSDHVIL